MPIAAGTRLGVYEFIAPIGAGGMGEVYRAREAMKGRFPSADLLLAIERGAKANVKP